MNLPAKFSLHEYIFKLIRKVLFIFPLTSSQFCHAKEINRETMSNCKAAI